MISYDAVMPVRVGFEDFLSSSPSPFSAAWLAHTVVTFVVESGKKYDFLSLVHTNFTCVILKLIIVTGFSEMTQPPGKVPGAVLLTYGLV